MKSKTRSIKAAVSSITSVVLLSIACLVITGCDGGEPGFRLSGTVRDKATGQPIAGATVADERYGPEPRRQAVTDSTGWYEYLTWSEEHTIIATAPGYKPERKVFPTDFLQLGKEADLNFELIRK